MKTFWDERYQQDTYAYGTAPNAFFAAKLAMIKGKGTLLLPGEGEGRNALYAAQLGWKVHAFDFSEQGRGKALQLFADACVEVQYDLMDFNHLILPPAAYDAIGLVFVHLPSTIRQMVHHQLMASLKPEGWLIAEWFSKNQLSLDSGGPKDPDMLYNEALLREDFAPLKIELLESHETHLDEGPYHQGRASVLRLVARK